MAGRVHLEVPATPAFGSSSGSVAVFASASSRLRTDPRDSGLPDPTADPPRPPPPPPRSSRPSFCVVSGGTGCNALCGAFLSPPASAGTPTDGADVPTTTATTTATTTFVLPVSDSGGSSSEIIRVLGGPSIGDIRSRLVRLIPCGPGAGVGAAAKELFGYRLGGGGGGGGSGGGSGGVGAEEEEEEEVKREWRGIVEGRHRLWRGVPADRRECIRAFLVHFEHAVLKRAHRRFSYRNASVGNCWLAAALLFFRSLQSAIFLFASITGIPESTRVLPVIDTSSIATIAAELDDGSVVVGQCDISHPAPSSTGRPSFMFDLSGLSTPGGGGGGGPRYTGSATPNGIFIAQEAVLGDDDDALGDGDALGFDGGGGGGCGDEDDGEGEGAEAAGRGRNLVFTKEEDGREADLPSPIRRIYYINQYGQEIFPRPNPAFLSCLATSDVLVYSCGSLYTSIVPCLALRGVGRAVAASPTLRLKVLLLNTRLDRETRSCTRASQFVRAVADALAWSDEVATGEGSRAGVRGPGQGFAEKDFVTHLLYIEEGEVEVDLDVVRRWGIECVRVQPGYAKGRPVFDEHHVQAVLDRLLGRSA